MILPVSSLLSCLCLCFGVVVFFCSVACFSLQPRAPAFITLTFRIMASALTVGGTVIAVPEVSSDAPALFNDLGEKLRLHTKVVKYLLETVQLASLEEFGRLVTTEEAIGDLIAKVPDLEGRELQTARLRMAWCGVREAMSSSETRKKRGAEADDLDDMLPQPDLDNLKDAFWLRYKESYEPEEEPSDTLVSRLFRELLRRLLTTRDVWATRSLAHQLRRERKRSKLTDHHDIIETEKEVDVDPGRSLANFLLLHPVLMLAYARAGALKRDGAPEREPRGSDTTRFVQVPKDVVMRYHRRLVARAKRLSELGVPALEWVQSRDEAERSAWVKEFRDSDIVPLGEVIQNIYNRRDGMWTIDEEAIRERKKREADQRRSDTRRNQDRSKSRPRAHKGEGRGSAGSSGRNKQEFAVVDQFRDGVKLCAAWNKGRCLCSEPCPDGKHVCNRELRQAGRACGQTHKSTSCSNPKRAGKF